MRGLALTLRTLGLFFTAAFVQWLWSAHFAPYGLAPQILLVLTVAAASRQGPAAAMSLGFFWGLFLDALIGGLFGANALILVLLAYLAGLVRHQMNAGEAAPRAVLVFAATWAYFLLLAAVSWAFTRHVLWGGWTDLLILPFYNSLVAVAIGVFNPWGRSA